jgi:hypothetical protein
LADFRAAVFCLKASKIVQSRTANSSFSQRQSYQRELPFQLSLVINLKTAKRLGLTVPDQLLVTGASSSRFSVV